MVPRRSRLPSYKHFHPLLQIDFCINGAIYGTILLLFVDLDLVSNHRDSGGALLRDETSAPENARIG